MSILRTQLKSKNAEVEMERLTKAQEMESQAQEYRNKMKNVQKELEHMRTQLEFKVRCVFLSFKVLPIKTKLTLNRCTSQYVTNTCKVQLAEPCISAVLIM